MRNKRLAKCPEKRHSLENAPEGIEKDYAKYSAAFTQICQQPLHSINHVDNLHVNGLCIFFVDSETKSVNAEESSVQKNVSLS